MKNVTVIRTEDQYRRYREEVGRLAEQDPASGTSDGDRLELLAKLVEDYEKERFPIERPDPVSAILFRMEEQGLKQKDLAPLLGGKSRVSEVLGRKRPLTLSMIRALNESLQIPVEVLVRESSPPAYGQSSTSDDISLPLLREAGWFPPDEVKHITKDEVIRRYLGPMHGQVYLRHTITYGTTARTNKQHLQLWIGKVREIAASTRSGRGSWKHGTISLDFLGYLAQLSWSDHGPLLAREFLAARGISVVVLPALPQTWLDGAAMLDDDRAPIIGLTVRQDRLDNFWFTLMHELVHAWKHLSDLNESITDENIEKALNEDEAREAEANRIARESFIPRSIWKRSEAFLRPSTGTIGALADSLHISPAVIAGRLRREKVGYRAFGRLVGQGRVRRLFPEVKWT